MIHVLMQSLVKISEREVAKRCAADRTKMAFVAFPMTLGGTAVRLHQKFFGLNYIHTVIRHELTSYGLTPNIATAETAKVLTMRTEYLKPTTQL